MITNSVNMPTFTQAQDNVRKERESTERVETRTGTVRGFQRNEFEKTPPSEKNKAVQRVEAERKAEKQAEMAPPAAHIRPQTAEITLKAQEAMREQSLAPKANVVDEALKQAQRREQIQGKDLQNSATNFETAGNANNAEAVKETTPDHLKSDNRKESAQRADRRESPAAAEARQDRRAEASRSQGNKLESRGSRVDKEV